MPGQYVSNVHVDALLSNLARLYRPMESGFIANDLCPILSVRKESDLYPVFTQGDFYGTDVDDLVADRSEPRFIEFSHTTESYRTHRRELGWDVSDRERSNADDQLNLERNKQVGTLGRLLLKREIRVANLLRKTTNGGSLTNGADAAAAWDTAATTSIESDIYTGITTMRQAIGLRPNVIVIPAAVAQGMQKNTQLRDWFKYTFPGGAAPALAQEYPILPPVLFGMSVRVPGAIQNTAGESVAGTESYSDVWSEQVRMLYVTGGPDIENPSCAYTFQSEPLSTRRGRDELKRIDWFVTGWTIEERIVAPLAGYEINNCLA